MRDRQFTKEELERIEERMKDPRLADFPEDMRRHFLESMEYNKEAFKKLAKM